ncbi:hypothetical protein [Streptomyces alanosinicus]|uniref:DNRLRE domain-containing protein n=1 Tax=Streptomyces alanosinicus TaxID=68171 RepID=A0A918YRD7_9ACTN|nr:hypothetical protein [Streptomyces alanosinicus]GHE12638.1 hypothetical protein GCM10010339_76660 [Streptomyces alanosinicus]
MNARKLALLAVGGGLLAGLLNAPAAEAAATAPVAFTGQADTSTPLDRAQFTLRADLPATETAGLADGDQVPMLTLPASSVTTSGNSFTVAVDPADVPARYVGSNGLVSLDLEIYDPVTDTYAWTTQSVRLTEQQSVARSTGGRVWADPLAAGRAFGARAAVSRTPQVAVHLGKAPKGLKKYQALKKKRGVLPQADTCRTTKVGQSDAWATIGEGYPAAPGFGKTRGQGWMTHSNGSEITYGAALSTEGTKWSASGSSSVANTKGFSFEWAPDSYPTISYRTEVRYYKYAYDCGGVIINRTLKAVSETGGVKTIHTDSNPPYWLSRAKCTFDMPAGTWTKTTGSAYNNSGGVKISSVIGIELSTARNYTKGSTLSYKMDAGHDSLCGNTDKPNYASKVQQYYNRIQEEL